jgi:predicted transcriptional regulator
MEGADSSITAFSFQGCQGRRIPLPVEPAAQFAANVRRLRTEQGLTMDELADRSGLRLSDVAKIETQGRQPMVVTIAKLARGLQVDPGELFKGVEP